MKIIHFDIYPVATPPPHIGGECWLFVCLKTDNGIVGVGEIYSVPYRPNTVAVMAADVCEQHIINADPFKIEHLWRTVYARSYGMRPDPSLMGILSGIEIACWDIIGKALDKPVHALLGGKIRDTLRTYTYLYPEDGDTEDVYTHPQTAATRAAEYAAWGFTAVKFDAAGPYTAFDPRQISLDDLTRSETFARLIRDAVGDKCDLLFGAHGQMTPAAAIRLAKRLEPYDPLWLEEPTAAENPDAMAQVARGTSIPIATGERLTTKYEFANLLSRQAVAILQPNAGKCGGILEMKKIAAIAEVYYAQIAPHLYCGPVVGAANAQIAACIPNFLVLEGLKRWDGFCADILTTKLSWQDGYLIVPEAPGLGIELNYEMAQKHRYTENQVMHPRPLLRPL